MAKINKISVDGISYDIEDKSVPSWAKSSAKPTYKTSELENDSNFITETKVDEKIANVSISGGVDLSNYATKEELPTKTSELENDSGYVTNTDYASNDNVGLVKTESYYGLHTSSKNGSLYCGQFSYDEYTNNKDGNCFIGKGTLENVLEAKDYASKGYVDEQISNIEITGGGSGSSSAIYSSNEQVVGTYLDKPLYKKTYTGIIQYEHAGTYYTIIKLENEEKFERVIDFKGFLSDTTNEVGNLYDIHIEGVFPIKLSNGNVDLRAPQMFYNKYFEVTLYYTKTTV